MQRAERSLPVFSKIPGQVGSEMVTALPKRSSPLGENRLRVCGEKTTRTPLRGI